MTRVSHQFSIEDLCGVVQRLSSLVEDFIQVKERPITEMDARVELVGCILGSQVRYETCKKWMEVLLLAGCIEDRWWTPPRATRYRKHLIDILGGSVDASRYLGRYRFFLRRADQIAQCRNNLAKKPLLARLADAGTVANARRALVESMPGIGPKQASMLLRNLGYSLDVAVLDSHVLNFLQLIGAISPQQSAPSTLSAYERIEAEAFTIASDHGVPVGHLDWAIWATMKVASELSS